MKRTALAVTEISVEPSRAGGSLDPLRRRLLSAGGTSREAVLADLLEDDLDETAAALAALGRYVDVVRAELCEARGGGLRLLALTQRADPAPAVDRLDTALTNLRKRMGQLARRLPG
ncbi:MAG TPA: hypothetical protein VF400_17260 [Anaeromyxobacteraceae bacterium]